MPRSRSRSRVALISPRSPSGSLSTMSMSGRNASAVCRMMDSRSASTSSKARWRVSEEYSPFESLVTPGTRTKSTRAGNSKLPMRGEPETMRTERSRRVRTSELAIRAAPAKVPEPERVVAVD